MRSLTDCILLAALGLCLTGCSTNDTTPASLANSDTTETAQVAANIAELSEQAEVVQLAATSEPESADDRICRRETVVGSHLPVRRCYTRAEIEQQRQAAQTLMRNRRPAGGAGVQTETPQ